MNVAWDQDDIVQRIATVEERLNHVATKAWVLGGALFSIVTAATLAVAVIRLW